MLDFVGVHCVNNVNNNKETTTTSNNTLHIDNEIYGNKERYKHQVGMSK